LSFKHLRRESYRLLGIISHLAPDPIPLQLLCQDRYEEFEDAFRELRLAALVRESDTSDLKALSIHRLVQTAFRGHITSEERLIAFDNATQLTLTAMQNKALDDRAAGKQTYDILHPHIENLKGFPERRRSETGLLLLHFIPNSDRSACSVSNSRAFFTKFK
jgi:hypothetical protein